jgi:hypothetical protein
LTDNRIGWHIEHENVGIMIRADANSILIANCFGPAVDQRESRSHLSILSH